MRRRPHFAARKQGLAHAQRLIVVTRQRPGRRSAEDTSEFFEQGMPVRLAHFAFQAAAPAFEPGAKCREADLDALGNRNRIDELAETHEFGFLRRILVAVPAVEPARRLREIGRVGHVKHPAGRLPHLGERHGGLARPRRSDDHEGNLVAAHRLLRFVEDNRSVEEFKFGSLRGQPSQLHPAARGWLGLRRHIIGTAFDLQPVDRGAAQKAGFFIGVIEDHFQKQADRFAPMRRELHQEPRLVVEFGAPVRRRRQLLKAGRGEISAGQRGANFLDRLGEPARREITIGDDSHP